MSESTIQTLWVLGHTKVLKTRKCLSITFLQIKTSTCLDTKVLKSRKCLNPTFLQIKTPTCLDTKAIKSPKCLKSYIICIHDLYVFFQTDLSGWKGNNKLTYFLILLYEKCYVCGNPFTTGTKDRAAIHI